MQFATGTNMLARKINEAKDRIVLSVIDHCGSGFLSYRDSKMIVATSTATARARDEISRSQASLLRMVTFRTAESLAPWSNTMCAR